jgi:hypothetical protein
MLPDPVVERRGDLFVIRDDLLAGGTKRRVAPLLLEDRPAIYAGPAEGFAQVALAHACHDRGLPLTICVAARAREHRATRLARAAGAEVVGIRPGYLTVVAARARELAAAHGWQLLPFGLDDPRVHEALRDLARDTIAQLPDPPSEIWSVAGSGVLTRALQAACPSVPAFAVRIGRALRAGEAGRARLLEAPEQFAQDARRPPPFPSCPNYDAKAWRFLASAKPGAVFWNVAA